MRHAPQLCTAQKSLSLHMASGARTPGTKLVRPVQARERLWATLSGKARAQFTYPQPGAPRDIDSQHPAALAPDPPPAEEGAATDTFALAVLAVRSVDYLVLTDNERRCFTRAEGSSDWQETLLNP